ncbi:hypothetical protein KFU94_34550 [Chloroflexi bacterium TSY]|nr:hypothetical protein [Chloroflexi bacterium TSY]
MTRALYVKGYSRTEILKLYHFIDWLMQLPSTMEANYWREVRLYEEREQMAYVTYAERIGRKQGLEQGLKQGLEQSTGVVRDTLVNILRIHSGLRDETLESIREQLKKITELPILKELTDLALLEPNLTKFYSRLDEALEQTPNREEENSVS